MRVFIGMNMVIVGYPTAVLKNKCQQIPTIVSEISMENLNTSNFQLKTLANMWNGHKNTLTVKEINASTTGRNMYNTSSN